MRCLIAGTVAPSANPFQTADMKRADCGWDEWGIIRRCRFDQENFYLITKIYIHTTDRTEDIVTICCSLLLQRNLLDGAEAAISPDWRWQLSVPAGDTPQRSRTTPLPALSPGSKVSTTKSAIYIRKPHTPKDAPSASALIVQRWMCQHKRNCKDETPRRITSKHNHTVCGVWW